MFSHSLSHSSQLMQTDITDLQMSYFFNIPKIPIAQPRSTLQVNPTWEARKGTAEHRGVSRLALSSLSLAHFSAAPGLCFHSRYPKYSLFYHFSGHSVSAKVRHVGHALTHSLPIHGILATDEHVGCGWK